MEAQVENTQSDKVTPLVCVINKICREHLVLLCSRKRAILIFIVKREFLLAWEGIEFGNFILTAAIHYWNLAIESCTLSLPVRRDFITLLIVSLRLKRSEGNVARKLNCACAKRKFTTSCKVDTVRFHFLNVSQLLIFLCSCLYVYIEFMWRYGQCGRSL